MAWTAQQAARPNHFAGDEGLEPVPVPSTPEVLNDGKIYYDDGKEVFTASSMAPSHTTFSPTLTTATEATRTPDKPFHQMKLDTEDDDKIPISDGPPVPPKDNQPDNRSRKKLFIIIGCIVAIAVILAAVLGGVLGSRKNNGGSSSEEATASPSASATSTPSKILAGSSVGVAAFQNGNDNEIYLSYKNPDNAVKFFRASETTGGTFDWKTPELQVPDNALDNVTAMTMFSGIDQSSDVDAQIQVQLLYLDTNAKLKGLNYVTAGQSESKGFTKLDVNDTGITISPQSDIAAWGPFTIYQNANNSLSALWWQSTTPWTPYTLQYSPIIGSKLSIVPVSRNASHVSGTGWWAVFYQNEDGTIQAVIDPGHWPETRSQNLGDVIDLWTTTYPKPKVPLKHSFAAFSIARDPNKVNTSSKVSTFLLYQDDTGDIKQAWVDNDKTWQTSAPDQLKGADNGTDISCITTPAWEKDRTFDGLLLQAASDLTKCYFQKGGKLMEVRLSGTNWVDPKELALP
ncbi:unnamed protein product [Clonostachys rhizophaga]|uniref:Fucose-specific lectin n=1 Tax=Clonostachys rhizophaga TaxID=160324 RepID=A0A9N9VDG4_9HYPO|nr:unnamed protein product [Clonostachys rhizophaga]